jgi:hypothetical protein
MRLVDLSKSPLAESSNENEVSPSSRDIRGRAGVEISSRWNERTGERFFDFGSVYRGDSGNDPKVRDDPLEIVVEREGPNRVPINRITVSDRLS